MKSFFTQFSLAQYRSFLFVLLAIKALLMTLIIFYAGIGLGPDEAQYWTWSQALDWGYYSKPPGIAWQIWLGTQLFGQTEWGVRSLSVILSIFQALAVYRLALAAELSSRAAFGCGVFMAFCPLGIAGSLFAITDVGFLLCWTGTCLTVVSALQQKQAPNPLTIGIWIMVGALFKWPIYLFWLFVFLCHHWYFPDQRKTSLLTGVLLSLTGLFPSIWWNGSHQWATFRHVSATLQGGSGHKAAGNVGEFLGSQAMLLSPILFILLLCGLWQWFRQRKQLTPALFICGFVTLTSLGFVTILSFFQKIQGNWVTFAYPTGLIILGWSVFQQHTARITWAKIGVGLSIFLTSILILLPSFYLTPRLATYAPAYKLNPFKHNVGWSQLPEALVKQGYDSNKHFLFSDKYQTTSILSFYGPDQKRAYFLNLLGLRNNQFSYWPSMQEERQAQTGYFVWIENMPHLKDWAVKQEFYQKELQSYFEKVEFLTFSPLVYQGPLIVKGALIFRCEQCKNVQPMSSSLY